jgi:hypothetical protein
MIYGFAMSAVSTQNSNLERKGPVKMSSLASFISNCFPEGAEEEAGEDHDGN